MEIKQNELGQYYYTNRPKVFNPVISPSQFFVLKPNKKKWIKDNIELVCGCEYLVFSPNRERYYIRNVHVDTNPYELQGLMTQIKNQQIYIKYSDEYKKRITKQSNDCGLRYNAMVKLNEIAYELNEIETSDKYRPDFQSVCNKLNTQIEWLNKQKKKN